MERDLSLCFYAILKRGERSIFIFLCHFKAWREIYLYIFMLFLSRERDLSLFFYAILKCGERSIFMF